MADPSLLALSPLDGAHRAEVALLARLFSDAGLARARALTADEGAAYALLVTEARETALLPAVADALESLGRWSRRPPGLKLPLDALITAAEMLAEASASPGEPAFSLLLDALGAIAREGSLFLHRLVALQEEGALSGPEGTADFEDAADQWGVAIVLLAHIRETAPRNPLALRHLGAALGHWSLGLLGLQRLLGTLRSNREAAPESPEPPAAKRAPEAGTRLRIAVQKLRKREKRFESRFGSHASVC